MSFEIHNINDLPPDSQQYIASLVSEYTKGNLGESPQMLPVEPDDILGKHLGYAALIADDFAGYIGALTPETHNAMPMSEVGSLWVPTEHRGKGIAHALAGIISTNLSEHAVQPYAFCNPLSQKIFQEVGYTTANVEEVPASALSACSTCPMQPMSGCCDTILTYQGVTQ